MAVTVHNSRVWDGVIEATKAAQDSNGDPLVWSIQLSGALAGAGVELPSPELADLLVSRVFRSHNVPVAWKFLEKALLVNIVPPILVLALLSDKVVPSRRLHPAAYRLYMELLKRHAFSFASQISSPNFKKIMKSVDEILHLSQTFAVPITEPGILVAVFVFSIVWQLLDASLEDERLLELTPEKKSRWTIGTQDMQIDSNNGFAERTENQIHKLNTIMAVEIIGEFFKHNMTSKILHLARRNMCSLWGRFTEHLQVLVTSSSALRNTKNINPEAFLQLTSEAGEVMFRECKTSSKKQFLIAVASESLTSSAGQCDDMSRSAKWLPFDLFFEDSMDGSQVEAFSSVDVLTGLVKSLQAVNQSTWQDAFLGLWIAALRLIQRERNLNEGPVPRLDTCLCMLLCIATLAISNIIEEEESPMNQDVTTHIKEKHFSGKRRSDLVSSLCQLGDYEGLLAPPTYVVSLANQAAAKAMMFLSGITTSSGYLDGVSLNDLPVNGSGNMRHLIVEACIARGLLDTSAYLWPGYVKGRSNLIPRNIPGQLPGWSALMKGSTLSLPLMKALASTPASSLGEIEKIYEIAVNGSDDEKIYSATILCGASLLRGWNIQEHVVLLIMKVLSPPVPPDYSRSESHLIGYAPIMNVLLVGISSIDCVQIFSLHGLVPHLAAVLMQICEVFGSCLPTASWTLKTGEEISPIAVFSNAFTLLLKLWRFDRSPLENVIGDVAPVGSKLTPDYLLLVYNSHLASYANSPRDQKKSKRLSKFSIPSSTEPIFMDSFPKLKRWYFQHQECLASTLSGLVPGSPAHQIFDLLLTMLFKKSNRGGQPTTSGSSNSSGSLAEEASVKLKLPAWEILEAIPFVLDAALTACAHGKLSPRELVTGLKDLADFLPASLATIVSYFSAEVTRGIWKPAFMNGTDWPSPAGNLAIVEQQIREILAGTGVDVPSLAAGGSSPATLPLPLAALVSLTITYKLDKTAERYLFLVGPSLITLAACCPWPCLPIIAALWSQKVRRWNEFFTFAASRTVFHHNSDAVDQLLKSCFTATLGLNSSPISSNGGVSALLGHGFRPAPGEISPVAPGILYLRVHRSVESVMFMTEEIVVLLMSFVRDIANCEKIEKLKKTKNATRLGPASSAAALTRVKLAATLGASLVWLTGGLSSIVTLIRETLPSWFISDHKSEINGGGQSGGKAALLRGYALAYFAVLCGSFAWGVDTSSPLMARRRVVLGAHLEFLASALDGKISLGCDHATWRAYVSGFVSLMVGCTPMWMLDVDPDVLKRVSKGLRLLNEDELALALLRISGSGAMGAAVELIIESEF